MIPTKSILIEIIIVDLLNKILDYWLYRNYCNQSSPYVLENIVYFAFIQLKPELFIQDYYFIFTIYLGTAWTGPSGRLFWMTPGFWRMFSENIRQNYRTAKMSHISNYNKYGSRKAILKIFCVFCILLSIFLKIITIFKYFLKKNISKNYYYF